MTNEGAAVPAHCDSCDELTATPPLCADCRAETLAFIARRSGTGANSASDVLWLLAEVDRLRDTLTRRGEQSDAMRADLDYATAERYRLTDIVQRVRALTVWSNSVGEADLHGSKTVKVEAIRRALYGAEPEEVPS